MGITGKNKKSKYNVVESEQSQSAGIESEDCTNNLENETEEENVDENSLMNAGWADLVSKILKSNKPKGKKAIVLSKAKKLTDVKEYKAENAGFEIQTVDGEIKEDKYLIENKSLSEPPHKKRRELPNLRVKPNILEKDRERALQKIATKGVVQLFNAVKAQQKLIGVKLKEAGPLEVKKEKALKNLDKREFLDMLMGEKSQKIPDVAEQIKHKKKESGSDTTWSVLKDDFMMSAKMKDWDKDLEEENSDNE